MDKRLSILESDYVKLKQFVEEAVSGDFVDVESHYCGDEGSLYRFWWDLFDYRSGWFALRGRVDVCEFVRGLSDYLVDDQLSTAFRRVLRDLGFRCF